MLVRLSLPPGSGDTYVTTTCRLPGLSGWSPVSSLGLTLICTVVLSVFAYVSGLGFAGWPEIPGPPIKRSFVVVLRAATFQTFGFLQFIRTRY